MKSQYEHIIHPFPPLYDNNSKILILGSLPSVKSREQMFFYGHPQNRFWKVITAVINNSGMNDKNIEVPVTIEDKKQMLHNNHIALWDTIYSCDIIGSSDSSIKNVVPTDLGQIISNSRIFLIQLPDFLILLILSFLINLLQIVSHTIHTDVFACLSLHVL